MFDPKDPIHMSTVVFSLSFACSIGILYLAKPNWVQTVNENTGKSEISWELVLTYSATFALVFAIAALLFISSQRGAKAPQAYDIPMIFPDPTMASAFCGAKHRNT